MIIKPYLIAEIGINHNGDVKIAKDLIDQSKKANFDCVKFQKRDIQTVYSQDILESFRESPWGNTQRKQKEGLEFGESEYDIIDQYCKKVGIDWTASAWDLNSLKFLDKYNVKNNKIASAMIIDHKFLEEVAKRKKHTFISTGMSTEKNIEDAVNIFRKKNCSFELMHCISTYPMKIEDANLLTIKALKERFKCNVGYSGHENGIAVSLAAFCLGISSLERHVTLDRTMYGSDQAASLELKGLLNLTNSIEKMLIAMGESKLGYILDDEIPIAKKLRAHLEK
jgi:N-acetylneuraminate synthase|tara:strand:- start:522 stop:1367 length:846 start_codon:yes stop_codon:yes gene_type:complete